jgi:hypothetical protein
MSTTYVNFDNTIIGDGSATYPLTLAQLDSFITNLSSAAEDVTIRVKGTAVSTYGLTFAATNTGFDIKPWEDGTPWKMSSHVEEYPVEIGPYDRTELTHYLPSYDYNVENGIIKNLMIYAGETDKATSGSFVLRNCIIFGYMYIRSMAQFHTTINGCTFVSAYNLIAQYAAPTSAANFVNYNDCVFINSKIYDNTLSIGTLNVTNCKFTDSYATISANIDDSIVNGTVNFNNCTFDWVPAVTFPAYDDINVDPIYNQLNATNWQIENTSETRTSAWQADDFDISLYNSTRYGPGAFNFDILFDCGVDPTRFGAARKINLTNFLPTYLNEQGEVFEFTKFFENYLNEMYDGVEGYTTTITQESSNNISTNQWVVGSIDAYTNTIESSATKISILEKVYRLAETHDPDLIDLDYIQHFAAYLGYNVDVSREELGLFVDDDCIETSQKKYLRFMVSNLPHWYKIKTTENAVKIMLFSFGMVGDIVHFYTNDYNQNWQFSNTTWNDTVNELKEDLINIDNTYYPTPHFAISYNINKSAVDFAFDAAKQKSIINAINSIRPINTVFEGIHSYMSGNIKMFLTPITRVRKHLVFISDEYADAWV